jgi:hypothetical protein
MDTAKVDIRRLESKITEEHLEIRAVVDKLQTLTDPNTILIVLEDLHRKMESHFLREEGDRGLYAIIEELAPDETERVDALLREHRLLMTGLIGLIRDCRTLLNEPLARLRADTDRFIAQLQAHDVSETEILTDCMLKEMDRPHPKRRK